MATVLPARSPKLRIELFDRTSTSVLPFVACSAAAVSILSGSPWAIAFDPAVGEFVARSADPLVRAANSPAPV